MIYLLITDDEWRTNKGMNLKERGIDKEEEHSWKLKSVKESQKKYQRDFGSQGPQDRDQLLKSFIQLKLSWIIPEQLPARKRSAGI